MFEQCPVDVATLVGHADSMCSHSVGGPRISIPSAP